MIQRKRKVIENGKSTWMVHEENKFPKLKCKYEKNCLTFLIVIEMKTITIKSSEWLSRF